MSAKRTTQNQKEKQKFNQSRCRSPCSEDLIGDEFDTKAKEDNIRKAITMDNGLDKHVKTGTAVNMDIETVLVMIFTVLSLANYVSLRLPKFDPSPHISSTPFLNTCCACCSVLTSRCGCYFLPSLKVVSSMMGKLKEGVSLAKNCFF